MVDIDKAVIARLRKQGKTFEVLVDCEKAIDLRHGKDVDVREVLAVEDVFTDAKKGLRAGDLKSVFGTEDVLEIAKEIIKHGDIQLTQEYRKKLLEQKVNRIINTITTNAYDPRTNAPIPPERIRLAMEQAKVHIDLYKPDKEVMDEVVEALKRIMPISFEKRKLRVIVPAQYAMKAYSLINKYKVSENWLANGDLECYLEVLGGLVPELYDKLNKLTHGNVDIKEVN